MGRWQAVPRSIFARTPEQRRRWRAYCRALAPFPPVFTRTGMGARSMNYPPICTCHTAYHIFFSTQLFLPSSPLCVPCTPGSVLHSDNLSGNFFVGSVSADRECKQWLVGGGPGEQNRQVTWCAVSRKVLLYSAKEYGSGRNQEDMRVSQRV